MHPLVAGGGQCAIPACRVLFWASREWDKVQMDWWNNLRLKSKDPRTRRKAIESLDPERGLEPSMVEALAASLDDEESQVRAAAAKVLGAVQSERSMELLIPRLRDGSPEVRCAAAAALGRLGDGRAASPVAAALKDVSPEVRQSAAVALRSLGWRASNDEEQALFEVALGNTRAAAFIGRAAVNPLVSELDHDTSSVRRAAAEALEGVEDPRRVQPLLAAITDTEPTVRVSAIHALNNAGGEQVTRALFRALRDPEPHVRLAAAVVLARRENADLVPEFLRLLNDSHFEVRLTAVQFLGRARQPHTVEALLPRLGDKDSDVRLATARALGEIGSPTAIETLVLALIDDESAVRHAAELSLNQIDHTWAQSEAAQRACLALQGSMNRRPAWVRAAASELIGKLRPGPGASYAGDGIGSLKMAS